MIRQDCSRICQNSVGEYACQPRILANSATGRALVLCCLLPLFAGGCGGSSNRVVLYCAQDQEFAELVLGEFAKRTGIRVDPKYDTEADKSVSLYAELVQEKNRPRCDVHWNNEILSTIRLQRQ